MEVGLGLYARMLTRENLRFARQIGATSIIVHMADYKPGLATHSHFDRDAKGWDVSSERDAIWSVDELQSMRRLVESEGLRLAALENLNPGMWCDVLLDGPRKEMQLQNLKQTIANLGKAGIPVLGICFTLAGVWGMIRGEWARGNASTVAYSQSRGPAEEPIPNGWVWNRVFDPQAAEGHLETVNREQMRQRRADFFHAILPVAQESGVTIASHPDDPPLPVLRNTARLLTRVRDFHELVADHPNVRNALQFCVGTVAEMPGEDIYGALEELSSDGRIATVHLRNVVGKAPEYTEVFLDEGDVDIPRVLRILKETGFRGTIVPDHTPLTSCDAPWHAGMAWALGYLRGVLAQLESDASTQPSRAVLHA